MSELDLSKLEAENYAREQYLDKINKRAVNEMMRYVKTCTLSDMEYQMVRRKIIESAEKAQNEQQGFSCQGSKGMTEYCNTLIKDVTGRREGYNSSLQKIGNVYFYVFGILGFLVVAFSVIMIFLQNVSGVVPPVAVGKGKLGLIQLLQQGIYACIYIVSGKKARQEVKKQEGNLLRFAVILIILEVAGLLFGVLTIGITMQVIVSGVLHIICAIIYKNSLVFSPS